MHFSNTLFRTLSWPRSTKTRYSLLYSHSCHLCRSGPGQTSKKCIEKVQCTDSVDFKKFLPPEHPFSWSNKEQGHFSPCRLIILLVCCSMSIETDVLVVKKIEINRVHTLHCSNTLFRTLSWPRSTKTTYIFFYITMLVSYVDRGQDKLRKSALKKRNVRIRLISIFFYHRNIRFPEATRSKVMCNRVVSSSSWSGVLCPLKPTFWW